MQIYYFSILEVKSEMGLYGLKSSYQQGCVPFGDHISLTFSSYHGCPHSLTFVHLQSQHQQVNPFSRGIALILTCLPPSIF